MAYAEGNRMLLKRRNRTPIVLRYGCKVCDEFSLCFVAKDMGEMFGDDGALSFCSLFTGFLLTFADFLFSFAHLSAHFLLTFSSLSLTFCSHFVAGELVSDRSWTVTKSSLAHKAGCTLGRGGGLHSWTRRRTAATILKFNGLCERSRMGTPDRQTLPCQ